MKYVLLFNVENNKDAKHIKKLLEIMPEIKIENYGVLGDRPNRSIDTKWRSIWVPEDKYLFAYALVEHKFILNKEVEIEEIYDRFDKHKNDPELTKYF